MSLAQELEQRQTSSAKNIPAEKHAVMQASTAALKSKHLAEKALKNGDKLPPFNLPNALGSQINSEDLLSEGPLVISFYRGGWCPYCNMELRALQQILGELNHHNAQLVAISPETPDHSLSTKEKNELTFEVLSDEENSYAKELGLVFQMPEDLREVYHSFNLHVDQHNGNEDYELPMPATYVIDASGTVVFSFVPEDYTYRLEPSEIIEALERLNK
ncbi:MAG: AhpC/TSA family protein [Ekhidna sp.]|nr:AhpC/TSA family protein [Ekhidna sp.]